MFIQTNQLSVRKLQRKDISLLVKWLSDPLVLEFYEGRDNPFHRRKVIQHFYKQNDKVIRCIVMYKNSPIGYVQFYPIDESMRKIGHYGDHEIVYGMDQFIGETHDWNQGIGTLLIRSMTDFLKNQKQVDIIVMDPRIDNRRALTCYEKCDFTPIDFLPAHEWHEGEYRDCLLIENRI